MNYSSSIGRFITAGAKMSAAQLFALLAGGRAWTMLGSRKNSKPRVREMPENGDESHPPKRSEGVHAVRFRFVPLQGVTVLTTSPRSKIRTVMPSQTVVELASRRSFGSAVLPKMR